MEEPWAIRRSASAHLLPDHREEADGQVASAGQAEDILVRANVTPRVVVHEVEQDQVKDDAGPVER